MSMLADVMKMAQKAASNAAAIEASSNKPDTVQKENRAAWRKLMESAVKEGNKQQIAALSKNAPAGADPSMYLSIVGMRTPLQQAQSSFDSLLAQQLSQLAGGEAPTAPTTQTQVPTTAPSPSEAQPTPVEPVPTEPVTPAPEPDPTIFTKDFLLRSALKKLSGIDVGAHYFEAPAWFESYGKRVKSGVPVSQAVSETAIEFGFIPDGASALEGLSEQEQQVIFEREFSASLNDPTLDAVIRKIAPKGANIQKLKAGYILDALSQQSRYIPEHYQPLLDRFRGLDDPAFVSDDLKTWIYQTSGKMPSEITPDDIAKARKDLQNDAIVQAARKAAATVTARTQAERDLEAGKPISAEDRAKYGVGREFPTYASLADAGKRFPSENERKIYSEFYTMRTKMESLRELLFGTKENPEAGIFTGIGDDLGSRTAAKGTLISSRVRGSLRGQNLEIYNDLLATFARGLIKIAGETGSRLTDVDIRQIMRGTPDSGEGLLGVPDSEAVARRKFDHFMVDMGQRMEHMLKTLVIEPVGQPEEATRDDADAAAEKLIQQYMKQE